MGVAPFEMLYGRDAKVPLGVDHNEVVSIPIRGSLKYLKDLKKRQDAL